MNSIKIVYDYVRELKERNCDHLRHLSYREQLQTKEWKYFRLYVIHAKGIKCELCDDKNFKHFQIHHRRYINGCLAWEYELEDLMVVCRYHHEKIHWPVISEKWRKVKSIKEITNG